MLAAEFGEFDALLRKHSQVFAKKLTDDIVQGYWAALKDLSMPTVVRCADNHLRYGKFFPKPAELRPRDDAPATVKEDQGFKAAVEQNIRNWNERLRENPLRTKWMLLDAYVARISVTEEPASPIYAERMSFAREVADRLLAEGGDEVVFEEPNLRHTASRLKGGLFIRDLLAARRPQVTE